MIVLIRILKISKMAIEKQIHTEIKDHEIANNISGRYGNADICLISVGFLLNTGNRGENKLQEAVIMESTK